MTQEENEIAGAYRIVPEMKSLPPSSSHSGIQRLQKMTGMDSKA
jgi:hypothetical protein